MYLLQHARWINPKLLGKPVSQGRVAAGRFTDSSSMMAGNHQERMETLMRWILKNQSLQFRNHLVMLLTKHFGFDAFRYCR